MRLEQGTEFAGYRIIRLLGEGGMGSVYLAQHPRLPREDALKLLSGVHASNAEFRGRFEREADVAAGLRHPNIVSVYDRGAEGDQLWISMQYVDGVDAADLVAAGPKALTPERALVIIGDAAKALDHAHRNGVLHRDVKPANILVTGPVDDSGDESALLTDFGIARAIQSAAEGLTMPGYMVGTTAYAAPEMLRGGQVDHRIDVYALACTLYEMLTGRQPFQRDSVAALMTAHLTAPAPVPSQVRMGLPPAIDRVIARGLAKDPNQRYNTCRELARDAAAAFGQSSGRTTPSHLGAGPVRMPGPPVVGSSPVVGLPPVVGAPRVVGAPPVVGASLPMGASRVAGPHQPGGPRNPGPPPIVSSHQPVPQPRRPAPGPSGGRNNMLIWGAVAAAVVILIGVIVLVIGLASSADTQNTSGATSSSESTSEATSAAESSLQLPAEPTAEADDGAFVVSIPEGWNDRDPDKIMRLSSDGGDSSILVSRNPEEFQGADVLESADIGSKQIVDELDGRIDPGGIESTTVGGEPAAKVTYTLLAVGGQDGMDVRGRQYYVRHNGIEYIVTCSGTVDSFNTDVADFEFVLRSLTWLD